jgi:predicted porin
MLLDYAFSKRTDAYLNAVYQKASGGASARAWITASGAASAGDTQTVLRVGVRHAF